jgi:hypothetical protein
MINIPSSPGVKLALLEAQLLSGEIDRSAIRPDPEIVRA